MWKTVGLAAGAVAAGTLVAGSTLPVSGAANNNDDGLRDFRVRVVMDEEHFVNNQPAGESPGDVFMFTSNLRRHGERVGRAAIQCTLMPGSGNREEALCEGAVNIYGKGQITLQVLLDNETEDERFAAAITGGTGKFADAGGEMIVIDPPGPREHWRFDFTD